MIERYAQDALARYGRVRQLDPAGPSQHANHRPHDSTKSPDVDALLGRRRNLWFRSG